MRQAVHKVPVQDLKFLTLGALMASDSHRDSFTLRGRCLHFSRFGDRCLNPALGATLRARELPQEAVGSEGC